MKRRLIIGGLIIIAIFLVLEVAYLFTVSMNDEARVSVPHKKAFLIPKRGPRQ